MKKEENIYIEWSRSIDVVLRVLWRCDLEVPYFGDEFDSPLLRFGNRKAEAYLYQKEPYDRIMIRVANAPDEKKHYWTIPDYYAAYISKTPIEHLTKSEQAVWWIRSLVESINVLFGDTLPNYRIKKLPEGVNDSIRTIYEGFVYLVQIRLLYDKSQKEHPYAYDFIRRWCGIGSYGTISKGLTWLKENDYIREVRRQEVRPGFTMTLYALVTLPSINELEENGDIPGLIDLFCDEDRDIRGHAMRVLHRRFGEQAIGPLIKSLERDDVRTFASSTLGMIKEPAVEPLIQTLKHEDHNVRGSAVMALGKIKDTRAVEPLFEALAVEEDEEVKSEIAKVLLFDFKDERKVMSNQNRLRESYDDSKSHYDW